MNEEEKKALKVINARTRRLLDKLEIEKEDMSDELEIAYLMQEIRANKTLLNLVDKLQQENERISSENRRLKTIRYSNEWGTENIHLITKNDLVEIDTNIYMIEIENGKFVDLKQVYQDNEELKEINNQLEATKNEAIRRYNFETIPKQKIKDKIEELKKNPLKIKQNGKYYYETSAYNKIIISVLQELLEK